MHPFSVLTLGIFVAGYITARWDLVTRLYELAIFAWDHGVVVRIDASSRRGRLADEARLGQARATKGFLVLSLFFFLFLLPIERVASRETALVGVVRSEAPSTDRSSNCVHSILARRPWGFQLENS